MSAVLVDYSPNLFGGASCGSGSRLCRVSKLDELYLPSNLLSISVPMIV